MSPTGDLDLLVLSSYTYDDSSYVFNYFENTGTSTTPVFVQRTGSANPFDGIDVGEDSAAAFADIDGDSTLMAGPSVSRIKEIIFFAPQ